MKTPKFVKDLNNRTPNNNLVFILLLIASLVSCKNDLNKIEEVKSKDNKAIQTVYDSEIIYSDSAKVKAKLISSELNKYGGKNPYIKFVNGFQLNFYDQNEEVYSKLSAEKGKILEKENKMLARKNVRFENEKGETLHTEELIWLQKTGKIYTDKFVKVEREDGILYGKGLTAKEDFSKYTIKEITGEFTFKKQSNINGKDE
ncbi:MAG: LPS export ABC transporter periplasmic protein LptC [Flavobacteriales bacterium]